MRQNVEVNNALFVDNPPTLIEAKTLEVLSFFEDPDNKDKSFDWWKNAQT